MNIQFVALVLPSFSLAQWPAVRTIDRLVLLSATTEPGADVVAAAEREQHPAGSLEDVALTGPRGTGDVATAARRRGLPGFAAGLYVPLAGSNTKSRGLAFLIRSGVQYFTTFA